MAMRGVITQEEKDFVETWRHTSPAQHGIIRLNSRGDEEHQLISGDRQFMITTEERIITQMRIRHVKNDPFQNGAFRPILVPDSVTPKSNPNAITDEEIRSILVSSSVSWEEWMKQIDSPETLQRMIDLSGETETTVKRLNELVERRDQLRPQTRVTQKDADQYANMGGPTTPSGGPPAGQSAGVDSAPKTRRGRGGRSADYR